MLLKFANIWSAENIELFWISCRYDNFSTILEACVFFVVEEDETSQRGKTNVGQLARSTVNRILWYRRHEWRLVDEERG
jgi:hypothetical protein